MTLKIKLVQFLIPIFYIHLIIYLDINLFFIKNLNKIKYINLFSKLLSLNHMNH